LTEGHTKETAIFHVRGLPTAKASSTNRYPDGAARRTHSIIRD